MSLTKTERTPSLKLLHLPQQDMTLGRKKHRYAKKSVFEVFAFEVFL